MHVDGFRFDLAVSLGRTRDGFDPDSPFLRGVAEDPVLSGTKLIAEPWDLGPDGYQLGNFPSGWLEWSDRFRDTTRKLWRGDAVGSDALVRSFRGNSVPARPSIHFVTCHDGFTLRDLVSYEQKHNWANGENNRDGHNNNLSRNWGVEGATDRPEVLERRRRATRNLLATTLLSAGVPMMLYGDESGRSQGGNNNAYCQDSELTWIDWTSDQSAEEMIAFATDLVALRKRLAPLNSGETLPRIVSAGGRTLDRSALPAAGTALGVLRESDTTAFLIMVNPGTDDSYFRLPRLGTSGSWKRIVSTVHSGHRRLTRSAYRLAARSLTVAEHIRQGA